jgi:transcriptional regulator with XRE-family HTH domain
MDFNFGEKIKALRKARDLTQEQLAEVLGVSYQAVSKWETNAALPDVTLFPILARFFGVTTDELHGMEQPPGSEVISQAWEKSNSLFDSGDFDGGVGVIRDLVQQMPNNYELHLSFISSCLFHHYPKTDTEAEVAAHEAITLLERILTQNAEADTRQVANYNMSVAYLRLGDRKTAMDYASKLPSLHISRECAVGQLFRNEPEGVEINQKLLRNLLMYARSAAECLADAEIARGIGDAERRNALRDAIWELEKPLKK